MQVLLCTLYCSIINLCKKNPYLMSLDQSKSVYVTLNTLPNVPGFFSTPGNKQFDKTEKKGENAGNQHFLLFSTLFLPCQAI